ncbi:MAG: Lrp/AsnC ligand binding domain-containing protein [Bacteroidales bacterium]|nr:Lrp/AsnC ligand binding domain-containing protein [Bacteroidales bacterium]
MAKRFHIDTLDRRILGILAKEVRIPYTEIARLCNVTASAIHQRVQKLHENNILDSKTFRVDPQAIDYLALAYVGVQINLVKQKTHQEVFEHIKNIPEVVECHNVTGKYSFLLKIYAHTNEHLKQLLVENLQSIVEVVGTETFISLEEGFSRSLPVE